MKISIIYLQAKKVPCIIEMMCSSDEINEDIEYSSNELMKVVVF